MVEKRNRLKSWVLWLSIAALIVWVVKTFWHIDISKEADEFMNILLPIVVGFGVVNNPTDPTNL